MSFRAAETHRFKKRNYKNKKRYIRYKKSESTKWSTWPESSKEKEEVCRKSWRKSATRPSESYAAPVENGEEGKETKEN